MALGVVQGVAEVVPVSSSAQLALLPWLLGWEPAADRTTTAAALHAGSCAGIAWGLRREPPTGRELLLVGCASLPAAVAGLLAADAVEQRFGRPPQLAALLAGAGTLMWWADARAARGAPRPPAPRPPAPLRTAGSFMINRRSAYDTPGAADADLLLITRQQAAVAAVAQVAALVPGVSRSGAVLTALRLRGVQRAPAERFSLLMSLPVTAGAAGLTLVRARSVPPGSAAGAATAAVAAALATSRLRARPGRSLRGPALYRLGVAAVVAHRLFRKGVS